MNILPINPDTKTKGMKATIFVNTLNVTGLTISLVPDMAAAAVAAGADGLMIEVHPNPEIALSDGYQSLTFQQFEDTMIKCRKIADALDVKM